MSHSTLTRAYRCTHCRHFSTRDGACPWCGAALHPGELQPVDGAALHQAVASSPVPVLVDLFSSWCEPCRRATSELEELARKADGRLVVLTVDTEDNPVVAPELHVAL